MQVSLKLIFWSCFEAGSFEVCAFEIGSFEVSSFWS